ncbi:MAG: M20/M25/M40 family metallo-hydrolase [Bdellovibrionota bacterium]
MKNIILIITLIISQNVFSHISNVDPNSITAVYADLDILKKANVPVLYADQNLNVGYAIITGKMEARISALAHEQGRCGNYEALDEIPQNISTVANNFAFMNQIQSKNQNYEMLAKNSIEVAENPLITEALKNLKPDNIKATVTYLSAFPTRFNKGNTPNLHVDDFSEKIKALVATAAYPVTVDLISHNKTPQKSIRVTIKGSTKPDEYVILGGHLDSISGGGFGGGSKLAPGADDNASGSASLLEALRILITQAQPQRTVEFFWYAGEESGLLGSAEIAASYKAQSKNVISVLQLDMTMFPGDGVFRITSINDFTSAWLRDYLKAINTTYLNVEILDDKCGYGCSDHASWFRNGYPTLMPTEAKFKSIFKYIHTDKDVISSVMNFDHALVFSKIALVMAMDLGNSSQKEVLF